MQVLGKILREIEKESYSTNTDYGHSVVVNMDSVAKIIRSHMEDDGHTQDSKCEWFEDAAGGRILRPPKEEKQDETIDDGWIPVEMKDDEWTSETVLPEEGQKVFVTISYNGNARMVERAYFEDGSFWDNQRIALDYITKAWTPRFVPVPYQPKEGNDEV